MLPSTPRPPRSGDDRTRTGGLSPDKRVLCASELRPRRKRWKARPRALHRPLFCHLLGPPVDGPILSSAGGIRTHGLELMRLARTASPLPRSNRPCGKAARPSGRHRKRRLSLAGRSRTCGLRRPKPVGWPAPLQPDGRSSTPGGTRTRSFRVEGPASSPLRPRGHESSGGRTRTCALASNSRASYRLDHAGTKNGGSRTRTCERLEPSAR
jgi:hypothetical protein